MHPSSIERPRRAGSRSRLARLLAAGALVVAVLVGGVYLTAWLSLDVSAVARAIIWRGADVDDYRRFPARTIEAGDAPFRYETGPGYPDGLPADVAPGQADLAAMLSASRTTAFIVVKDDELVYERYFNGHGRGSIQTSFSVAKSFNSALVGCAVADGFVSGLDDPVTRYVPELLQRDERFARITIRHLLSMSSGLRYVESGTPWGDDAATYYAPDLRALGLQHTEIVEPPGRRFHYNNFNPLLLGMVLERATGKPVSTYLSEKLWKPLGAEVDATWSLDSANSGFEKMESGINARAIDFVKLGSLYLAGGSWRGRRLVPAAWVAESTRYSAETDSSLDYQYGWWTYRREGLGDYFVARGNKGQFVFVFPRQRLVISRHGIDFGGVDWMATIPAIAMRLAGRSGSQDASR